jgi:hypothetical protein
VIRSHTGWPRGAERSTLRFVSRAPSSPPLVLGVVRDATGDYVMAFVLLVAFAWLCAGQALAVREPQAARAEQAPPGPAPG